VILDNVSSHGSAKVHEWLEENPDRTFHFTPTSASWTNAVEGFFSKLARQRPRNAVFDSLDEFIAAVGGFRPPPQREPGPPVQVESQAGGSGRVLEKRMPYD